MRILILMGSPRHGGNTAELCKPFREELERLGAEVHYMTLSDKNIHPCLGCYACQDVEGEYGCVQRDDMYEVVERIVWADCVVLATPIYAWYCTAPMKAVLDRHYGLNKFYRSAQGSLWKGKYIAILATHGYDREYGAGPFETGVKRLCEHSSLNYLGNVLRPGRGRSGFLPDGACPGGGKAVCPEAVGGYGGKKSASWAAGRGGEADGLSRQAEKEAVCPLLPGAEARAGAGLLRTGVGRGSAHMAHL